MSFRVHWHRFDVAFRLMSTHSFILFGHSGANAFSHGITLGCLKRYVSFVYSHIRTAFGSDNFKEKSSTDDRRRLLFCYYYAALIVMTTTNVFLWNRSPWIVVVSLKLVFHKWHIYLFVSISPLRNDEDDESPFDLPAFLLKADALVRKRQRRKQFI